MILHGKDLIISANGSVIAASKSCQLSVEVDSIKVSSPTDGQWEHIIAGMKSWKLTTNNLMPAPPYTYKVQAFAQANNSVTTPRSSYVKGNNTVQVDTRGLTLLSISPDGDVSTYGTFDTYGDITQCDVLASVLYNVSTIDACAIVSWDAFGMTDDLKTAIASKLHVDMSNIPTGTYRGALVVIGQKEVITNPPGIVMFRAPENDSNGGTAHAELTFNGGSIVTATPLRNAVARVGQMFDISVQLDGYGSDRLTGRALCRTFNVSAARTNLMQGSFKFDGSGPLV